jgi:hypothetical protein
MRDGRAVHAGGAAKTAFLIATLSLTSSSAAFANDLRVETGAVERVSGTGALRVPAKVSWKNAWRNARNHDAVWLFVKVRNGPNAGWRHARLLASSRSASPPLIRPHHTSTTIRGAGDFEALGAGSRGAGGYSAGRRCGR